MRKVFYVAYGSFVVEGVLGVFFKREDAEALVEQIGKHNKGNQPPWFFGASVHEVLLEPTLPDVIKDNE